MSKEGEIILPFCSKFIGHEKQIDEFLTLWNSGRASHAFLFKGLKGIGKASLSVHIAALLLENKPITKEGLIKPNQDLIEKMQLGGLGNFKYISCSWDEKKKKFLSVINVNDIRTINHFYHNTAHNNGWRICIIDSVDDMNISSSNALLKTLEEPPAKTLFILIAHNASILPTIQSRCAVLNFFPLKTEEIIEIAKGLNIETSTIRSISGSIDDVLSYNNPKLAQFSDMIVDVLEKKQSKEKIYQFVLNEFSAKNEDFKVDILAKILLARLYDYTKKGIIKIDSQEDSATAWLKICGLLKTTEEYNLDPANMVILMLEEAFKNLWK